MNEINNTDSGDENPVAEPTVIITPTHETVPEPDSVAPPIEAIEPEPTTDDGDPEITVEPVVVSEPSAPTTESDNNITDLTQSWALVRNADGLVETFLRLDLPSGWKPPEGFSLIPDDQLPARWSKIPQEIPVPQTITATQIRLWLVNNGFSMTQIYAIISQISDPLIKAQIEVQWEYAPYVERNHPMINTLGASLGLDSDQIDQAFREASSL
jgi:hypothetical protein